MTLLEHRSLGYAPSDDTRCELVSVRSGSLQIDAGMDTAPVPIDKPRVSVESCTPWAGSDAAGRAHGSRVYRSAPRSCGPALQAVAPLGL